MELVNTSNVVIDLLDKYFDINGRYVDENLNTAYRTDTDDRLADAIFDWVYDYDKSSFNMLKSKIKKIRKEVK